MFQNKYKFIYKKIKQYDRIVIARHVGPDPDCLGAQIALRDIIKNTFPKKEVYAVGYPASRFSYLGTLDKMQEEYYQDALLIVVDLPDKKRIDGVDPDRFAYRIKIDHHPFIETFCDYEWIDDTASSASQMIMELVFQTKLTMTSYAAERLYLGLVSDTNRFLFQYTTSKTFDLVSKLIKTTGISFTNLYENLYLRPLKEIRFQGYIGEHLTVTEAGFAYIKITNDILQEYHVDAATAGNMVNNFNYIDEILAWAVFTEDKSRGTIRGSLRSRGPIVNEVATHFGGGGHIYASGVRLENFEQVDTLVEEMNQECEKYKKGL